MKKRVMLLGMGVLGLMLAGCIVKSIYPFYTEKDLVEVPGLIGKWVSTNAEDKETWTFTQDGSKTYRVSLTDNNETNDLSIHMFKLDGQLFFDYLFTTTNEITTMYFAQTHQLAKVTQVEPILSLQLLNYDFISDLLEKDPNAIRHVKQPVPDSTNQYFPVLTADTMELQAFLRKHMGDTNLFSSPGAGMKKAK